MEGTLTFTVIVNTLRRSYLRKLELEKSCPRMGSSDNYEVQPLKRTLQDESRLMKNTCNVF